MTILKKIFSHTTQSITLAALILGGASLASRGLGLVRDRLLTHQFGASATLDAYYAAFRIPDLLYNLLILGALSAAFIPLFTRRLTRESRARAWELMNTSITTLGLIFLFISGICILATPFIVRLIAPGFSGEKLILTTNLTRIMMVSPIIMGLSATVGGALQALKKFALYAFAPIMYNLGIIFGIIFLVPKFGPVGLAYGVIIGGLLHLFIQIPALIFEGYRPSFRWGWGDRDIHTLLKLMGPRTFALASTQIYFVIMTVLASRLTEGSVAVFNLAFNIQSLPIGIIAVSYAVAAFPQLTEAVATDNPDSFAKTMGSTTRMILLWLVPLTILLVLLHTQWVRIIFGSGQFNWEATRATGTALGFFALGLVGQGLVQLYARAFYAQNNTFQPAVANIATDVLGLIIAIILMRPLGVTGLALAYSINMMLNALILWALLRKANGPLEDAETLTMFYKLCAAALVMLVVVQGLKSPFAELIKLETFVGVFTQATGASLLGLMAFVGVGLLLKISEIVLIVDSVKNRAKKMARFLPIDVTDVDSAR